MFELDQQQIATIQSLIERMPREVYQIPLPTFEHYKYEIVSMINYLYEIAEQTKLDKITLWLASLYLR